MPVHDCFSSVSYATSFCNTKKIAKIILEKITLSLWQESEKRGERKYRKEKFRRKKPTSQPHSNADTKLLINLTNQFGYVV